MLQKVLTQFIGKRWWVIALLIAGLVTAGYGIQWFEIDASSDSFVLEDDADLRATRSVAQAYGGGGDSLIIVFKPEGGVFTEQARQRLTQLKADLLAVNLVHGVNSILDIFVFPEQTLPLSEALDSLVSLTDANAEQLETASRQLPDDPVFTDLLINRKGTVTTLQLQLERGNSDLYTELTEQRYAWYDRNPDGVTISAEQQQQLDVINAQLSRLDSQNIQESKLLVADVRQVLSEHRRPDDLLYLAGPSMIIVDSIESLQQDMQVFGVMIFIVFIALLSFFLKGFRWVVLPVITSTFVVLFVAGIMGWVDWKVSIISANFIAMLTILTLTLMVHLMTRHRSLAAQQPDIDSDDLSVQAHSQIFVPSFYSALTTGVAFGSLMVSGIVPVIEFGKIMMLGIAMAFVIAFALSPVVISLFSSGVKVSDSGGQFASRVTAALASFALRFKYILPVVAVAILAVEMVGINRIIVDNKFINYFKKDTEIYQGMALVDQELGGTIPIEIVVNAPNTDFGSDFAGNGNGNGNDDNALNDSANDEYADEYDDEFADDYADDFDDFGSDFDFADGSSDSSGNVDTNAITSSYWLTGYGMSELRAMQADLEQVRGMGKLLSLSALYELGKSIRAGEPLSDFELGVAAAFLPNEISSFLIDPHITDDGKQIRFIGRIEESVPDLRRAEMIAAIHEVMQKRDYEYQVVGLAVLYNNMLQSLFQSQIATLTIVFVVIAIMLVVLFKSIIQATLVMIPTVISAGGVLGFLGWVGQPLDILTVTVASISVGIAVDNAIHYTYRFKELRAAGHSVDDAIRQAHASIGMSVFATNTLIIAGFLIFTLSNFVPTVYFGLLTAVALLLGLLGTLTLLPALFSIYYGRLEPNK